MSSFADPKCSKELSDEDLEQVIGGGPGYSQNECRPSGFSFYVCSSTAEVLKINEPIQFLNAQKGWLYSIDKYINGVYKGRNNLDYNDDDIDFLISNFGQPQQ